MTKDEVIKALNLLPLEFEGGFFSEVYRSNLDIPKSVLPESFAAKKYVASTSIYYLLGEKDKSSARRARRGRDVALLHREFPRHPRFAFGHFSRF